MTKDNFGMLGRLPLSAVQGPVGTLIEDLSGRRGSDWIKFLKDVQRLGINRCLKEMCAIKASESVNPIHNIKVHNIEALSSGGLLYRLNRISVDDLDGDNRVFRKKPQLKDSPTKTHFGVSDSVSHFDPEWILEYMDERSIFTDIDYLSSLIQHLTSLKNSFNYKRVIHSGNASNMFFFKRNKDTFFIALRKPSLNGNWICSVGIVGYHKSCFVIKRIIHDRSWLKND